MKHLEKLAAQQSDADRLQRHDKLHKRMLTPKLTRMLKETDEKNKLLERRPGFGNVSDLRVSTGATSRKKLLSALGVSTRSKSK